VFTITNTASEGVNAAPIEQRFNRGLFSPQRRVCYPDGAGRYYVQQPFGRPGTISWNRNNGWVLDLAVDPLHSNVVYSAAAAVRKSTDGGHTWKTVLLPRRGSYTFVTRIAIAPTRPESIYAIAHNSHNGDTAIYKSTDGGRSWQTTGSSGSSLPPSCCGDAEDALAVDPGNPQTLYAVVGDTVLATTDGGVDWQPIASGLPANDVTSLAVDPRSETVYASIWLDVNRASTNPLAGAIYKTTDGGQTWSEIYHGSAVLRIDLDTARPSTIYAAAYASPGYHFRLLRSTDSGRTWATAP
jgi:photosystem II stability/assembly factor-like uncharacterized protein